MPIIVDGKKIAAGILARLREEISLLQVKPHLAAVLVGNDPASISFLNEKKKKCDEIGIEFTLYRFDETITTTNLRKKIHDIRGSKGIKAVVIQLPLPPQVNTQYILDAVRPEEDVDALSSRARGLLATGKSKVLPPTAEAVLNILETYQIDLSRSHVVLVGLGALVGKPLLNLLADKAASLGVVHAGTPDITRFTKDADIVIAGTGRPGLIGADMVKDGVVALDAGYSRIDGKVSGDIQFEEVSKKARLITPVPGGIGPITVAMLMKNVLILAKNS
ncbi:MAG: bifunctional 5,10-methylenetetrahydrofolate dehydrogenase/5,10-methenyltetrahydrofolate cyclohydrolase [bacterium]|nr:bifunctional 5,10-methylenetetrahydrofolate dehydrogenase/5,10-methenyltetrahydrofolate cyclohydrolase [bacterium]